MARLAAAGKKMEFILDEAEDDTSRLQFSDKDEEETLDISLILQTTPACHRRV